MRRGQPFTLSREKAEAIARAGGFPVEQVRDWCLAIWPTGRLHQKWLDTTEPGEIAVQIDAHARQLSSRLTKDWPM